MGPLREPSLEDLLHLVGGSRLPSAAVISLLEDQLEEEAEQLPGLLHLWVRKRRKADIVEVSKVLKVLDKLLARLEAVCGFLEVLLLQEGKVDELVFW